MKKPLLAAAATLAVAALTAAPATADTFKGSCHVTGIAKFQTPLKGQPAPNFYDFNSGPPSASAPDGTVCTGSLNGGPSMNHPATAGVKGAGQLSCASSTSTDPGSGLLIIGDSVFPFAFEFKGAGTEVAFTATYDGGSSPGHASFAAYTSPPDALTTCNGDGFTQLGFDADLYDSGNTIHGQPRSAPPSAFAPFTPVGSAPQRSSRPAAPCSNLKGRKRTQCLRRRACLRKKGRKRAKCLAALRHSARRRHH